MCNQKRRDCALKRNPRTLFFFFSCEGKRGSSDHLTSEAQGGAVASFASFSLGPLFATEAADTDVSPLRRPSRGGRQNDFTGTATAQHPQSVYDNSRMLFFSLSFSLSLSTVGDQQAFLYGPSNESMTFVRSSTQFLNCCH